MKAYDINIIEYNNTKSIIVFSTNYISPLKEFDKIQDFLRNIPADIKNVYFDFLVCTKNDNERYAKIEIKDGLLNFNEFKYLLLDKDNDLRKISADYYKSNLKSIDWTYAGDIKRELISNGLII